LLPLKPAQRLTQEGEALKTIAVVADDKHQDPCSILKIKIKKRYLHINKGNKKPCKVYDVQTLRQAKLLNRQSICVSQAPLLNTECTF